MPARTAPCQWFALQSGTESPPHTWARTQQSPQSQNFCIFSLISGHIYSETREHASSNMTCSRKFARLGGHVMTSANPHCTNCGSMMRLIDTRCLRCGKVPGPTDDAGSANSPAIHCPVCRLTNYIPSHFCRLCGTVYADQGWGAWRWRRPGQPLLWGTRKLSAWSSPKSMAAKSTQPRRSTAIH